MGMMPIDRMWERVEIARQDSDTSLFLELLYCAEMVVKIVGSGMVAAIADDRERHRYRLSHQLVRADGIGDWVKTIDDILIGPASQHLIEEVREEQRELTSKNSTGSWQFEAVNLLHSCVEHIETQWEKLPNKVSGRRWLSLFAMIRNKTRGHGATRSELCSKLCVPLENSIRIFIDNFKLFKRPWAYLHMNLSGKYRVTKFTIPATEFDFLKSSSAKTIKNLLDGVYIYLGHFIIVELMYSNMDASDFFFPNGNFNNNIFEILSYITNDKKTIDATPYLLPATPLPSSETQGTINLEIQGKCFSNIPSIQSGYIQRKDLERELFDAIVDDRHPVITLIGRGGIGKTWLALTVLHRVAEEGKFDIILWFSARDIDLMPLGPKSVSPHVLSEKDIAKEFVNLIEPSMSHQKEFNPVQHLACSMTKSDFGSILFVFDNFETVHSPAELYSWIDTYIRLPNKVLITTRLREFKGDYPIDVLGMNDKESTELIESTARDLKINHLITDEYKRQLIEESSGHPYVIKILLGEVAKAGTLTKIERIIATMDEVLNALFERTYSGLSPAGKRLFLTLCGWRSTVPLLAIEAVLLRPENERIDVDLANEELIRSSFVETLTSSKDGEIFLTVPLVAAVFGKRKLSTSPMKSAIEADLQLLHTFGATQESDIKWGVGPRVERLFGYIADRITKGKETINDHAPMLEFIARKYPPAWLLIAKLYQETESSDLEQAKEAIRRYIESTDGENSEKELGWSYLSEICRKTEDYSGEIHALVEMAQLPKVSFQMVSNSVNRVNALFRERQFIIDSDEKRIISQRLAQVMESRIDEGDATDCSRLAWLFLRLGNDEKARELCKLGLSKDDSNSHCINILARINKL
jgi:hypothetical protein